MRTRLLPAALLPVALLFAACEGITAPRDPVMLEGGFVVLSVGGDHSCGVTGEGAMYCWGENRSGQLGTGGFSPASAPVRASTTQQFTRLASGLEHSCGLTADDRLFCWGANWRGQLGNASRINQAVPVEIAEHERFTVVSTGWFHTCALTQGGEAYCWGANGQAQLGAGAGDDVLVPQRVSTGLRFASISAGGFHTCAVDVNGRVHCWGANSFGQLGVGSTTDQPVPQLVTNGAGFSGVAAGYTHTCGLRPDGSVACWGSSDHGELGAGGVAPPGWAGTTVPVAVHGTWEAVSIASGAYTSCLVELRRVAWCWGRGLEGQLGTGRRTDAWTPQFVSDGTALLANPALSWVGIGRAHACGLDAFGVAWCWGSGTAGQLGAGPRTFSALAVRVGSVR